MLAFVASFCVLLICPSASLRSQNISGIVNEYAPVSYIDTCDNAVYVPNNAAFSVGDRVLLIQMKGATIDLSDAATFGTIQNYEFAGNYEFANISSIRGITITFKNKLINRYDINGQVQLVKVATYQSPVVAGTVTGKPWNGSSGGLIVIEASDSITFRGGSIDASLDGFSGGDISEVNAADSDQMAYYYDRATGLGGVKGESISDYVQQHDAGRGAQANGGGGGNSQNAGGGGGSNGGAGGKGGNQTSKYAPLPIGGLGGFALDYAGHKQQLFLGGGGGGGQQNDTSASAGAIGGGLVIIRTPKINALGGGSIISNGGSASLAGVDGAGGGGGGGTIALDVPSVVGNLTLNANGGNGGDNNADNIKDSLKYCYAPGGGAGGGRVITSAATAPAATVTAGKAGKVIFNLLACYNTSYGASDGTDGIIQTGLSIFEGTVPFTFPVAINRLDTICSGDSVQIGINGGQNFSWTPSSGLNDASTQRPIAFPNKTTTYVAHYQDYRGCPFSDTILVVVNQTPAPVINGQITVCGSDTTKYFVTSAPNSSYNWVVSGGTLQSGQGTDTIIVAWGSSPTGSVGIVAKSNGAPCSGSASITVTINAGTKPVIQGGHSICSGDTLTLSVDPGYQKYLWSNGDTNSSIKVGTPGKYSVVVGISGGCLLYSDTANIIVSAKPQVTINAQPPNLPDSLGTDTLYVSGNYSSALWNNGTIGDTLIVTDSGYFSIAVVDSNGCNGTATIHITRDLATPYIIVWTDTIRANPGDNVTFPLRLKATPALIPSGDTTWLTTMTFNKTLLAPVDKTIPSVINGERRTLTLNGIRPTPMIEGVLLPVPCIVAFGDTTQTVVDIQTFDFTSGKKSVIYRYNGLLIVNTCNAGGTRLYDASGKLGMGQTHPNPTSDRTQLDFDLLEDGDHELFLSDLVGRRVLTVFDEEKKAGHYTMDLDLRALPKGNYMYVLRTPSAVFSRILTIER